jgi:hypothetical protein
MNVRYPDKLLYQILHILSPGSYQQSPHEARFLSSPAMQGSISEAFSTGATHVILASFFMRFGA